MQNRNFDLSAALADARGRFAAANPASAALHAQACGPLPGGNTRTTLHFEPFPLVIERGQGVQVWDADGHQYTDFIGEYTAGLYGHSHPAILATIRTVLESGHVLCAPNAYEAELAALMCARFPSLDQVRFTNSGTEANLMIVTAARHFTGRDKIMVFNGGYHGGVFYFAHGPSPVNAPYHFVMGEYNDADSTLATIEAHAPELAAILIEPVMGTAGALPADREFLQMLRMAADRHGVVLAFDEVMTSRLSPGGAQALFDVTPDMTAFGKYIGGGLTVGAFGGRADLMGQFDPRRADGLPHSGTFNNNVLTMAAGVTGLRDVYTPERAIAHNARGDRFRESLNALARRHDVPAQVTGIGSLLGIHFQRQPIARPADTAHTAPEARALFHLSMFEKGFYTSKIGLSSLSLPLAEPDYTAFTEAFEAFLLEFGPLLR